MVAKKFIIKVMEEVLGEYIINMSKENLQVAVIRGKLKLDNVQLDGDIIGSHILGAVGLSGFAVISCTAAHLRATIPWSKLEKEPTKFELVGLQLICVPLLPSNAMKIHGAGTEKDPKCTLRTRVKRSAIARFERNFFSWRIPGEGPPRSDFESNGRGRGRKTKHQKKKNGSDASVYSKRSTNTNQHDDDKSFFTMASSTIDDHNDDMSAITSDTLNQGAGETEFENMNDNDQGAWRQKFAQKIFRNIEVSIRDLHVRCEVGEGAFNAGPQHHQQHDINREQVNDSEGGKGNRKRHDDKESSFAFGMNFDALVLKSANSSWSTGRNVDFKEKNKSQNSRETISQSGHEIIIQDTKYKVFVVKNMAMYWDDAPPIILTECSLLQNQENGDTHKIWSIIRLALNKMKNFKDPGAELTNLLLNKKSEGEKGRNKINESNLLQTISQPSMEHSYVISPLTFEMRLMLNNLGVPEKANLQAEMMPCKLCMNFNSKQMRQYRALQYGMFAQRRLDTMLHQRPTKSPNKDPRAWWRYAISCVTTRPTARPWRDVLKITRKRSRYIELVEKKHLNKTNGSLSKDENEELLELEELLPIETLLSFHLLALRNVIYLRQKEKPKKSKRNGAHRNSQIIESSNNSVSSTTRKARGRSSSRNRNSQTIDSSNNSISSATRKSRRRSSSRNRNANRSFDKDNSESSKGFGSPSRKNRKERSKINGVDNANFSFETSHTEHMSETSKYEVPSPTKSPLPRKPGRMFRKSKKGTTSSPISLKNKMIHGSPVDDEISIDSFASMELDNLVSDVDSAAKKIEFSLDEISLGDDENDEVIVEEVRIVKTIRCQKLTMVLTVTSITNDKPILQGCMRASTWIRQIPGEGMNFLFDVRNLEFLNCSNEDSSTLMSFEIPEKEAENDQLLASGIVVPLGISSNSDDDIMLETFCNQMRNEELPLPPKGVVSRMLVSERPTGRSFSLSAYAATMIWNKKCVNAFMETFFPSQNLESRTVLQNQLRNAATPIVHKAQVAMSAPKSMSINVNIDAPKVWFPVSPNKADGALFVDVGKMSVRLRKPELLANVCWSMECTGIHANLRRNALTEGDSFNVSNKVDVPIILPLNLSYEVERSGDGPVTVRRRNGIEYKQSKVSQLKLSKICIKLVDVEVLAKAISKWYASELLQVKRRRGNASVRSQDSTVISSDNTYVNSAKGVQLSQDLSVSIEKVQVYLQGPSDKSLSSIQERKKRIYLVELSKLHLSRSLNGNIRTTTGKLNYINIVQMKDSYAGSENELQPSHKPQHIILRCSNDDSLISSDGIHKSLHDIGHFETGDRSPDSYSPMTQSIHKRNRHSQQKNKMKEAMKMKFSHDEDAHVDDLDATMNSIEIRVTSTSLRDCYGATKRILEVIKMTTGEMEHRVHQVGRKIRRDIQHQISNESSILQPSYHSQNASEELEETSIIMKISLKTIAVLVAGDIDNSKISTKGTPIIQMLSNALIMFQSVENHDASGNKTLHISLNDYSMSLNSLFNPTSPSQLPPIVGPVAVDFRAVYGTENAGIVVKKEVSMSCDYFKSNFQVVDINKLATVVKQVLNEVKQFRYAPNNNDEPNDKTTTKSTGKGLFFATTTKLQLQAFSFVLSNNCVVRKVSYPLLDLRGEAYVKVEGCESALYGDSKIDVSLHFYSKDISEWVHIMEPVSLFFDFEKQANHMMLSASTERSIKTNLTSELVHCLLETFSEYNKLQNTGEDSVSLFSPDSKMLDVITLHNDSGIDFYISPINFELDQSIDIDDYKHDDMFVLLQHNQRTSFDLPLNENLKSPPKIVLIPDSNCVNQIGQRRPILNVTIQTDGEPSISRYPLTSTDTIDYEHEPIVEWCMQNQRIRSVHSNISAVDKGVDLLSNTTWSPSDWSLFKKNEDHWLHPYLDGDVHEWTDMTGALRMERERVTLPDNSWIWANNWTVEIPCGYGEHADADGWEYSQDFESFGCQSRFYTDGDACRRRRWTRTRLRIPPTLTDPQRPLSVVLHCCKDDSGNDIAKLSSPFTIKNLTQIHLSVLGYCQSWNNDEFLGHVGSQSEWPVPVHFSTMTHLRLAIIGENSINDNDLANGGHVEEDYVNALSDYILVIPKKSKSSTVSRLSISLGDSMSEIFDLPTKIHFTVKLISEAGHTTVEINPVVRIRNLLPCPLQFRMSEGIIQGLIDTDHESPYSEEQYIEAGMECSSIAVDSTLNPYVAFRVPGYRWSNEQRIVNRKFALSSWRPAIEDENNQHSNDASAANVEEYATIVQFERLTYGGDTLTLILEITPGDCPLLQVYAQYWIVDKTGFGLRFCDGVGDLLGNTLLSNNPRRSYLLHNEMQHEHFRQDMEVEGHEWTVGKSGMTMYFSSGAKVAACIDVGDIGSHIPTYREIHSNWSELLDISNVIPKAVFSVTEFHGDRQFDLSYDVSFAPNMFSKTKVVTLYSRFHIVNLSTERFYISQNGNSESTNIPPESTVPFHWEKKSFENKVRFSLDKTNWTQGAVQLDKVGITPLRLSTVNDANIVIQIEVRLAKKDHDSAVVVLVWFANDQTNPLYVIRNTSSHNIICTQKDEEPNLAENALLNVSGCGDMVTLEKSSSHNNKPINVLNLVTKGLNCELIEQGYSVESNVHHTWNVASGTSTYFGFDEPNKSHEIEWTCIAIDSHASIDKAKVDVDALGSSSDQVLPSGSQVRCSVTAENSTKVIEFFDVQSESQSLIVNLTERLTHHRASLLTNKDALGKKREDEHSPLTFNLVITGIDISIINNSSLEIAGREILLVHVDKTVLQVSQTRDGHHEFELRMLSLQIDNHIYGATHPVMLSCPHFENDEPFLHISLVRKLQKEKSTIVFRYVAFRLLAIDIAFDRQTAEVISSMFLKTSRSKESMHVDTIEITKYLSLNYSSHSQDVTKIMTSRRIYIEQLHLHPLRLSFTFTQDWDSKTMNPKKKSIMLQYVRKIPSLSNAELLFTSFVVSHAFESAETLLKIIGTHYVSQFTQHFFSIIGSLAIFNGPADFLANVGTGVRDFFYEPINGLVHGPDKFVEGLETGSISLARGIFVGVVRGAANVTYTINSNLINLTDEEFIAERNAYQRSLVDSLSRDKKSRTISDSLHIAGVSVARGVKSGVYGLVDEPMQSFAKQGPLGLVHGMGKALVGAVVKPMIGLGDGVVVVMNHVSELSSNDAAKVPLPKRLRRALPRKFSLKKHSIILRPFDERAAKAQKIVTGNETKDDAYLWHVNITNFLIIASDKCLWIINRTSHKPWCLNWKEISHFCMIDDRFMQIFIFSQNGLQAHTFEVESVGAFTNIHRLLTMQQHKMGNRIYDEVIGLNEIMDISKLTANVPGIECQNYHVFGSMNKEEVPFNDTNIDEIEVIEKCFARVQHLGGESPTFFSSLDEESWSLVSTWRYLFSGLRSRHCMVAGFINGTGTNIQLKCSKLMLGASPCYQIPTRDYDGTHSTLAPGAAVIYFAWGSQPTLKRKGQIVMSIETNCFHCNLMNEKGTFTSIESSIGYSCIFMEKSISDWWAKYWVLIKSNTT